MSEAFLNKIKYLCNKIANVEWSGPLFYSIKSDISTPENFEIILEDILPLDMGTKGYTEYDLDDRFIDYLMDKEERMDWNVGHIHSHNTFDVFFSGTDMAELNDNCPGHNFYLSLIVNNAMDFTAKVAFQGSVEQLTDSIPYYGNTNEGKKYIIEQQKFTIKKDKMYTYDCEIKSPPKEVISVGEDFASKVAEIMKPKPKPIYTAPVAKSFNPQGVWLHGKWYPNSVDKTPVPVIPSSINNNLEQAKLANKIKHYKLDDKKLSDRAKKVKILVKNLPIEDFHDLSETFDISPLEKFVIELVKFTTPCDPTENLEDALTVLEELDLDAYTIATSIMENYTNLYDKHFADATDEEFIRDTDEVVAILLDEVDAYPFINVAIEAIKAMIAEFEKNGTTYNRFKDAPWFPKENETVMIGGQGGIGSWLTLFLVRAGFKPIVFDFDIIEAHNTGGQLFRMSDVGLPKVVAISHIMKEFGNDEISVFNQRIDENSPYHHFMFSAFDNMQARKDMFELWKQSIPSSLVTPIFIDGRLEMEQMQVYCVTPDRAAEYEATLFLDSEVEDAPCTMKQTSHAAAMIATLMTSFFTNHMVNIYEREKIRELPFYHEFFIPLAMTNNEF